MKKRNVTFRDQEVNLKTKKTAEQQKRRKLLALQGKVIWEGDLDEMRCV